MTTRRTKIAALVAGCAVVAGGGYAAADALSSPVQSSPAAAALSSAVNSASSSPSSQSGSSSKSSSGKASSGKRKAGALARLRRLPGEYGQYTYQTKKKGEKVLAFERGTIASVSGQTVTVKAANGHTENWTLTSKSAVREAGKKTTNSALADGKTVIVAGPVSGSTRDARLVVIRDQTKQPAQKSTSTTTS